MNWPSKPEKLDGPMEERMASWLRMASEREYSSDRVPVMIYFPPWLSNVAIHEKCGLLEAGLLR